jgi:hypothetical protein
LDLSPNFTAELKELKLKLSGGQELSRVEQQEMETSSDDKIDLVELHSHYKT